MRVVLKRITPYSCASSLCALHTKICARAQRFPAKLLWPPARPAPSPPSPAPYRQVWHTNALPQSARSCPVGPLSGVCALHSKSRTPPRTEITPTLPKSPLMGPPPPPCFPFFVLGRLQPLSHSAELPTGGSDDPVHTKRLAHQASFTAHCRHCHRETPAPRVAQRLYRRRSNLQRTWWYVV